MAERAESHIDSTGADAQDDAATLVHTEPLHRGQVRSSIDRTGEIEPLQSVDLYPFQTGLVGEITVDVGDTVSADQDLLILQDEEFQLRERGAATSFDEAKSAQTDAQIALEEARDAAETAQNRVEQARREFARSEQLAADQLVTDREFETTKLDLDDKEAAYRAAEFALRRAEIEVTQTANRAESARISWEDSKLMLRRTVLRSPMAGVVTIRNVDRGAFVNSGTHVLTVVDHAHLIVNLKISQKDLQRLDVGQVVEIRAREAFPGREFTGRVERISPAVDPQSGTVTARVAIEKNPEQLLRPGLFVECTILTAVSDDSLLVPRRAVFFEEQRPTFFVVEDNIARKVSFFPTGGTENAYAIGQSLGPPLREGMAVVVIGKDQLQDGDTITTRVETDDVSQDPAAE